MGHDGMKFWKLRVKDRCSAGGGKVMSVDDCFWGAGGTEDCAGFVG